MTFFNNSIYRCYVYGNIITPNLIYKINNFEYSIVSNIRKKITNSIVIDILNSIFSPITGDDDSYPYQCETYKYIIFKKINGTGNIIYNNDILSLEKFNLTYDNMTFDESDILLLDMNIEYSELINKI